MAWCVLLTMLLYAGSLTLPFFFDDFVHYPFVEANTILEIWLDTAELAYYRPLNFSIWRLTYDLFDAHEPLVDHGINLALHALNGFLVGWLAARLWAGGWQSFPVVERADRAIDWWRVVLASGFFLLYPFSYQAVPWVGSMSHLLVTALMLLSLTAYVQMRRNDRPLWGAVSLFFALLAPFAHENGVLVMPFVVLIELTTPRNPNRWRKGILAGVVWTLPLLAYLPIWLSLPRVDSGGLFPNSVEGMVQNTAYFVQGMAFPATLWGGWLMRQFGLNDMLVVWSLSGLALGIAALIQLTHRASLRSLLPWLWMALSAVPAIVFLIFDYVINGPRLLMVGSVGVAWLWADVVLLFVRGARPSTASRSLRVVVAMAFTLLVAGRSALFVRDRMEMHDVLGDVFERVIETTVAAHEAGREVAVINFPSWLAARDSTFALGHEGVLFWPDYIPPEIFMAVHTGSFGELSFVEVGALRPQLPSFYYGPTGDPPQWSSLSAVPTDVYLTEFGVQDLALRPVGMLGGHEHALGADSLLASFSAEGQPLAQIGRVDLQPEGDQLRLDLLWEVAQAFPNTTVFVHLVNAAGQIVAQADGDPLGGSYPFESWVQGNSAVDHIDVVDTRLLPLTSEGVALKIGLYDRLTGDRISAVDADGNPLPDNALTVPVR